MIGIAERFRQLVLGISPGEACFSRRGFRETDRPAQMLLEEVGTVFIYGYNAALCGDPSEVARRLASVSPDLTGFAYEGAAMALCLLDYVQPTPRRGGRFQRFLNGAGAGHLYMAYIGAGWALARLPWARRRPSKFLEALDPLLHWLTVDGYGFHEGYFHTTRTVEDQARPTQLESYAARAFDQGLGRSLWFVEGADVERVASRVGAFPIGRRDDLWSGIGLASSYAGGLESVGLATLRDLCPMPHRVSLGQGAAFAANARATGRQPDGIDRIGLSDLLRLLCRRGSSPHRHGSGRHCVWGLRRRNRTLVRIVAVSYSFVDLVWRSRNMKLTTHWLRRNAARLVAATVILGLYGASRPSSPTAVERTRLAARFRFATAALPVPPGGHDQDRHRRPVHPALERISAWISSVGAAVALNDLDGDGFPNDVGLRRHSD